MKNFSQDSQYPGGDSNSTASIGTRLIRDLPSTSFCLVMTHGP